MKLLKYLVTVIGLSFYLMGCEGTSNDPIDVKPEITLSATPLSFTIAGGGDTVSLSVSCNTTWNITSSTAWCKPTVQTVKGDASVNIYIDANNVEEIRNASITISATGATNVVISVSQVAMEPVDPGPQEPEYENYIAPDATGMNTGLSAIEFSQLLGLGWNLGNSLEAINTNTTPYSGNETSWGNPLVNKQLIDSVKAAGFNFIRIPVSWSNHLDNQVSYKINWEWKKQVAEVVDYVIDNDMYAMINIHWDGGWMDHPTYDKQVEINAKIDSLWKQIAIFFRDYNDHLIFAGTNEVGMENTYDTPPTEYTEVQNSFNQTFVNTVRATGGRNTYRFLVAQGYFTNIGHTYDFFVMPTDATQDRLMTEVHYYDPWEFCLKTDPPFVTTWEAATWGKEDWVDETFGKMKTKFVDNGVPVILGEFGVVFRENLPSPALEEHIASRIYYFEYITQAAVDNGMVPMYWDSGATGKGGSGLFDRNNGQRIYIDEINSIVKAAK